MCVKAGSKSERERERGKQTAASQSIVESWEFFPARFFFSFLFFFRLWNTWQTAFTTAERLLNFRNWPLSPCSFRLPAGVTAVKPLCLFPSVAAWKSVWERVFVCDDNDDDDDHNHDSTTLQLQTKGLLFYYLFFLFSAFLLCCHSQEPITTSTAVAVE